MAKNGLERKNNYIYFTLCYLGMVSVMVVMAWLNEKEGDTWYQPQNEDKCGCGYKHSTPIPRD